MSNPTQAAKSKPLSVMILVPSSGDTVATQFTYCLTMCAASMVANGISMSMAFSTGSLITVARRQLVDEFMKSTADYAWWIDSDMTFPIDSYAQLINRKVQLVGCNYRRRYFPTPNFTAMNGTLGNQIEIETTDQSPSIERVDGIPHGMMMVHRSVYEQIPAPHYLMEWNKEKRVELGEDYYFCQKAKEFGINVWLDHALSRQISHIGTYHYDYNLSTTRNAIQAGLVK